MQYGYTYNVYLHGINMLWQGVKQPKPKSILMVNRSVDAGVAVAAAADVDQGGAGLFV